MDQEDYDSLTTVQKRVMREALEAKHNREVDIIGAVLIVLTIGLGLAVAIRLYVQWVTGS